MKRKPAAWLDPDNEMENGYLESAAFKLYAAAIKAVVLDASKPLSIRDIHTRLGARAKREWTADALETLLSIEPVGILPVRYRERVHAVKTLETVPSHQSFRRIFPHRIRFELKEE
jgi:hypothetical protein